MKKYKALKNIVVSSEFVRTDSIIELDDEKAKAFLKHGYILELEIKKEPMTDNSTLKESKAVTKKTVGNRDDDIKDKKI